tara:strand:+ start:3809 stop:4915 length:1107 start_codon:yes stop_codon:yes gene_type:complete
MSSTVIPWGDPKAINRFASKLIVDIQKDGYFDKRFVGTGTNNIIEEKTELNADSGDTISFDLVAHLRGEPIFGDDRVEGTEEALKFFTDKVEIDQVRKAVSAGGKMSRKRTAHDLRKTASDNLKRFWGKFRDEMHFITLAGGRGQNEGFTMREGWQGFANNPLLPPDAKHVLFGGDAVSKATLDESDKMSRNMIERASVYASMMQAVDPELTNMVPLTIEGQDHFVLIMSKFDSHNLRQEVGAGGWADLQKAAITAEGKANKMFKGGLGMIDSVILHDHQNVVRWNDAGAGGNVSMSRSLFCGRQAAALAHGTTKGNRMIWKELLKDYENEPSVSGGFIYGEKKCRFNGYDFGVLALDCAAKNPNAPA